MILYHNTFKVFVPNILRTGLLVNKFKSRDYYQKLGINNAKPCIYTVMDRNKLVIPNNDKRLILKIDIPNNIFDKIPKKFGDYLWDKYHDNPDELLRLYSEIFNIPLSEVKKKATPMEWMSPDNTVLIYQDINKKYITIA
jgi:hypothetical protein